MDETILFPSPNWFQPSGLAVSSDEWLVYGGPSKSLCVLQPLPNDYDPVILGQQGYTAHVVNRAHPEKIVCVDICPEWPEKRAILSGSADGAVKQWSLEQGPKKLKIKWTHSHEIHSHEKEEVAGVGYCKDGYAVTVGSFGNIVKWDLNSNVAKSFNHVLKSFKPVCMACSPHIHMNVAIGTKQGVVFVLDLNGTPRILYKVRGQDDEILKVSWCPQYEVAVRKSLKDSDKRSCVAERLEKIQRETVSPKAMKLLNERVKNSHTTDQPIRINEKCEPVTDESLTKAVLDGSGIGKTLPEDSFDETIVQEDDMFDIYKEPEVEEFGHKKYEPEDILVKIPQEAVPDDYLSACQKLKDEILKRKAQSEASIESLVDAMDKTEIEVKSSEQAGTSKPESPMEGKIIKGEVESSVHIQKHLLATVGKSGSIRVWSKSGKLVGSCSVVGTGGKARRGQGATATTLLWYQPDLLYIADGKSQLLECNPLKIDCKNKLEWHVVHNHHKRGLYVLATGAPRALPPGGVGGSPAGPPVWSAAQDRSLIAYWPTTKKVAIHSTCGGFLYTVENCPYDAKRTAISVGDGAVRVWEADPLADDDAKLASRPARVFWQNVQGKVLAAVWHPRREGLLAFGTAEARVGVIETGGKGEKPARVLQPALGGGVYSLSWGDGLQLYACGGGDLVVYEADQPDKAPEPLAVQLEGQRWALSCVRWAARALLAGSAAGALAVLQPARPHELLAAAFVFSKMIHTAEWHPTETSRGEVSAELQNLIAVCSLDRNNNVVIMQYLEKEDGTKELSTWKTLSGHKNTVLQVMWSPHQEGLLLSTSQDGTVRVWDVSAGCCVSIFGGHDGAALCAAWSPQPALGGRVLSGGADCCARLWDCAAHPAHLYQETKNEVVVEKKKRKIKKDKKTEDDSSVETDEQTAAVFDAKIKSSKRFLLPMIYKQITPCDVKGPRRMLQKYLEKNADVVRTENGEEYGIDYIKLFGNINEVNEVLDTEMQRLQDTGCGEAWAVLGVLRGAMDAVIQLAAHHERLDPFLLSLAPCVSFKYWKDATLLYLQQIDRLVAKGEDLKLNDTKPYGGAVYRKTAVLLSLHDVKGAVNTLVEARLFKEAYALSRTRYMDSLAEQTLRLWAQDSVATGQFNLAAVCYIALGDLSQAAAVLGKSSDEESLSLAADIAKVLGQMTFAGHIEEKRELMKTKKEILNQEKDEELKELPSRTELVLNDLEQDDSVLSEEVEDAKGLEKTENVDKEEVETAEVDKGEVEKDKKSEELKETKTVKTEDLVEKLPEQMEALMKDTIPNGKERGDENSMINGDVTKDKNKYSTNIENEKDTSTKTSIVEVE